MENKKFELTDEMLNTVSGGTGAEVPPEAAAEGLDYGVVVISDIGCDKCGCNRYRIIDFTPGGFFVGECINCKTTAFAVLRAYGGYGWTIA